MKHKRTEAEAARVVRFLAKLRANWGKRFSDDETEQEWLNMMIQELGFYSDDVLDKAASRLMHSKLDFFPRLQQCAEACAEVVEDETRRNPELFKNAHRSAASASLFSREREQLADDLCRHDRAMTRAAIEGGWILGLHNFIRREGRMPAGSDIAALKREAARFDANYAKLLAGEMPVCQRELTQFAAAIAAKRADLAKRLTA